MGPICDLLLAMACTWLQSGTCFSSYSSCKPMGKDSEIVATSTTAFDTHTQEEDTQDSEVAETQA